MMQGVHVKLNAELPWQKQHSKRKKGSFHQQTGLKFKEETSKVLHLEHSFVWYSNLDTSESRSEITGKF
jgi:hypothetical protein